MSRIRLGGIKVLENRAYVSSLCRNTDALEDICSGLAAHRINMGLVAYAAPIGTGESMTAVSARSATSLTSFVHPDAGRVGCAWNVIEAVCRISVFPHDKRPDVTAALIGSLNDGGVKPHGFASSPSAITVVISSRDLHAAMERVFDAFSFPACESYREWQSASRAQEGTGPEVRCRYHEDVIHVYDLSRLDGLDLWNVALPLDLLGDFGKALLDLGQSRIEMSFLVSGPSTGEGGINFAFCLAAEHRDKATQIFHEKIQDRDLSRLGPVLVLFLHGPHFGDRYGIADALASCLRNSGISPLALSCVMSSISLVIKASDAAQTIKALSTSFQTPAPNL
ncbi:MAG: hypothetical protein WAW37_16185 [Syntrophobacteraceae bacterium]